jgi:hypothetical protein
MTDGDGIARREGLAKRIVELSIELAVAALLGFSPFCLGRRRPSSLPAAPLIRLGQQDPIAMSRNA